jgi:hypothetical protein
VLDTRTGQHTPLFPRASGPAVAPNQWKPEGLGREGVKRHRRAVKPVNLLRINGGTGLLLPYAFMFRTGNATHTLTLFIFSSICLFSRVFYMPNILHAHHSTRRSFYTPIILHPYHSTPLSFYTPIILHPYHSTPLSFYTPIILHPYHSTRPSIFLLMRHWISIPTPHSSPIFSPYPLHSKPPLCFSL